MGTDKTDKNIKIVSFNVAGSFEKPLFFKIKFIIKNEIIIYPQNKHILK